MRLNGFWVGKDSRIVVFRVCKDGIIHYRKVDEKGKPIDKEVHKNYAEEIISDYVREY